MSTGSPKRRRGDRRRAWVWARSRTFARWWERWGRDVVTFLAVALAAYAVFGARGAAIDAQDAVRGLSDETTQRIDQTCAISETKQRADVDALIRTYRYLGGLSGRQLSEPLNKAVLANLPSTIREAQTDDAPPFCDKPGVGLPEPDPPLPCPPKGTQPKRCIAPPPNLHG
jgi:hypothetical protein